MLKKVYIFEHFFDSKNQLLCVIKTIYYDNICKKMRVSFRIKLPLDGMRFARSHTYPWHHKRLRVN